MDFCNCSHFENTLLICKVCAPHSWHKCLLHAKLTFLHMLIETLRHTSTLHYKYCCVQLPIFSTWLSIVLSMLKILVYLLSVRKLICWKHSYFYFDFVKGITIDSFSKLRQLIWHQYWHTLMTFYDCHACPKHHKMILMIVMKFVIVVWIRLTIFFPWL